MRRRLFEVYSNYLGSREIREPNRLWAPVSARVLFPLFVRSYSSTRTSFLPFIDANIQPATSNILSLMSIATAHAAIKVSGAAFRK